MINISNIIKRNPASVLAISVGLVLASYLGYETGKFNDREIEGSRLYSSLSKKVEKVGDENNNGIIDFSEATNILYRANGRVLSPELIESRVLERGFHPSITHMQQYLKSIGQFDEKADDSNILTEHDKRTRFSPNNPKI